MSTTRQSAREARREAAGFDWSALDAKSDDEIARDVAADPDAARVSDAGELSRRLREGDAVVRRPPAAVDVRAIRKRLDLTQAAFAARFGFSPRTVQQWEQGRRTPEGPARILLCILERRPELVEEVLSESG